MRSEAGVVLVLTQSMESRRDEERKEWHEEGIGKLIERIEEEERGVGGSEEGEKR